jgi:glutamate dehydrogenase
MRYRLDEAKAELITEAAAVLERSPYTQDADLEPFLRRYYRHVMAEDLVGRDPVDVVGAAMSHRALADRRPQGTVLVRVFTPTVEEHGWSMGHTVVEVVTDDMAFLVDSVTMELSRDDRPIHLVVHPQLVVRRDVMGQLIEICDASESDRKVLRKYPDAVVESWIHVEIDRESDPEAMRGIESRLLSVLRDVQEANEDWPKMRDRARSLADELTTKPLPVPDEERNEAIDLLRWLADDHFTFLGYRDYVLETRDGEEVLRAVTGSGLGILRDDQNETRLLSTLPPGAREKAREKTLLILTKANSRSTVHRPAYLDYISVKGFDERGDPVTEHRFLGLFTSAAYTQSVLRIPVLRAKVRAVLEAIGLPAMSHSGRNVLQILETYPRDELFHISVDELVPITEAVLHLEERRQLRLFVRKDPYGRYLSCLVYLPRDRYDTRARLRIQDLLLEATGGQSIDHTARVGESVLARLHFIIRMPSGAPLPALDEAELEQRLVAATRAWEDDLADALIEQVGEETGARLLRRYGRAFPEAYKEDFPARVGAADVRRLNELDPAGDIAMNLYQPIGGRADEHRLKIYRTGAPLSLTHVLPLLSPMGVEVIDERPYEFDLPDDGVAYVYDFGLRYHGLTDSRGEDKELFQEALMAAWAGRIDSDGFNALVLRAGLSWRQIVILRAYAKYLRQTGTTFSQPYIEECLSTHPYVARLLVDLFESRFTPALSTDLEARAHAGNEIVAKMELALDEVPSLDHDRILRWFLALVQGSLRTNFYQVDEHGQPKPFVSIKLDPSRIRGLPQPRPKFEVWVYSPHVEAVHLRFGKVARGGLRWSDRREDFRTEILGLVKAQTVKNAVIVPVGAKGGFIAKSLPDPTIDREAWLAKGIECYKIFIRGLLDLTDNRGTDGRVIPPPDVVRHDGNDTYLVVAADKGTATFSDIANAVSSEYGYWLGDAFASGGSAGYDHKAMAITARGAWESVKRYFREMGHDTQTQEFTCVGIGDMSGDVFGNAMLLSRHIRLVAAFDHRHIFLDPTPDAAVSYEERQRLFALPRSSWADYNLDLLSPGGGIYARTAKAIPVSSEVRAALRIEDEAATLTPNDLIRRILAAPVDLLFNGGVGTFVKASTESNADVGDKTNDAVRLNGVDVRARCVGEGGNLGLTQLGRVEYARSGGRINTDFIDNSAGVDTSDHEVNIKILLERVVRAGDLTVKQRNELLVEMTNEVADLVLDNNYGQNVALACSVAQAPSLLHVHRAYVRKLEADGWLDRKLEGLPSDDELAARQQQGAGLTCPELAVILAYTKNVLYDQLIATDLAEDPYLRELLHNYFPTAIQKQYPDEVDAHPLRREIIITQLVNEIVNRAGTTFVFRLAMETGSTAEELFRAYTVARAILQVDQVLAEVRSLDSAVAFSVQTQMRLAARTLAERASRWLVINRRQPLDMAAQIAHFAAPVAQLLQELPSLLTGSERARFEERRDALVSMRVPKHLAEHVAVFPPAAATLGIVETSVATGSDPIEVARVYFCLAEELKLAQLLERIVALPRADRWQTMARSALREELNTLHTELTGQVIRGTPAGVAAAQRVAEWKHKDAALIDRAKATLTELVQGDEFDLARLSVALRVVRSLIRTEQG